MKLDTRPHVPADKNASRRLLFERSTLGVAMIDSEFHFLIANPAFLTMAKNCSGYPFSISVLMRRLTTVEVVCGN